MSATCIYMKEPSISVLKNIYVFMGDLPQQVIEIFFRFGSGDFLIYRNAANRLFTLTAFLIDVYFAGFLCFNQLYLLPEIHTRFP